MSHPTTALVLPRTGEVLAGRYEVQGVLGEGGTGTVLAAHDRDLQRPVALKILHDALGGDALLDEARMLAAAQSPGVVGVFALHLDARPPFLVMERVEGRSLEDLLRERPLGLDEALRVLRHVARALDALHARGIAHGDVKAGNVLVDRDGAVRLTDLGIAPLLRRAAHGDVVGTPVSIPPERARALEIDEATHRLGDVYSFAVLAYALLAQRPPFVASSPHALLRAHATEVPPLASRVSGLSPGFDAPLARALSKDPHARQASAGELVRALERAARGTSAEGRALVVLVVDDDADQRELHRRLLTQELEGATVSAAPSGVEALACIARDAPRLVVLDLAMPEMSGLTVIEKARAIAPATKFVVVTGQGSGAERRAAAALGVRHFLVKPVETAELTRSVVECLGPRGDPTLR